MLRSPTIYYVLAVLALTGAVRAEEAVVPTRSLQVLKPEAFSRHIEYFNTMEDEPVVNLVPNAESWVWLQANAPFFTCDDATVEEIYWFRWWALRKHLRIDPVSKRHVFTEFLTKPRPVSSALGHHLMEGRWLRDQSLYDDYVLYWLRGAEGGKPQGHLHKYSSWLQYALWQRWLVTQNTSALTDLLDDLVADYRRWETEKRTESGLFWQADVWDGGVDQWWSQSQKPSPTAKLLHVRQCAGIGRHRKSLGQAGSCERVCAKGC
jgi:hypothetical protein